jgi:glycosyltransferase involved in cell wall biosynthesis
VIYNGIDLEQYQSTGATDALERYGVDPSKPYVLFVGRITRQKGIIHLVNAIPDIDPSLQIVLCAGAPDTPDIGREMAERVEAVSAGRQNVIWIQEMLARPDVIQFYSHATVFCCPSVYEPFGIINLEAMACERPVVASAVGGLLDLVDDGRTGVLVRPEDPAALARALRGLIGDPAHAAAIGAAARDEVLRRFGFERMIAAFENLYLSGLERHAPARVRSAQAAGI